MLSLTVRGPLAAIAACWHYDNKPQSVFGREGYDIVGLLKRVLEKEDEALS
jgi:hypothetical protein